MNILKAGYDGVSIIDPRKKMGEEGQCIKLKVDNPDFLEVVMRARIDGNEIRWYYRKLFPGSHRSRTSCLSTSIEKATVQYQFEAERWFACQYGGFDVWNFL